MYQNQNLIRTLEIWVGLSVSGTRRVPCDVKNVDIDVEVVEGAIKLDY